MKGEFDLVASSPSVYFWYVSSFDSKSLKHFDLEGRLKQLLEASAD